jgi:hypothetical protein
MAQFETPEHLLAAANRAYAAGYRNMDAYTPMPIDGLAEAVGFRRNWVAPIVLFFGLCGAIGGFSLLWWISVIAYPHNVAGRPFNSWPAYIPITFECTVLLAALSAVVGMLALNKLPMPYHPVFNVAEFAKASENKFFLVVFSSDPNYDAARTRLFLSGLAPRMIAEVPS